MCVFVQRTQHNIITTGWFSDIPILVNSHVIIGLDCCTYRLLETTRNTKRFTGVRHVEYMRLKFLWRKSW
jgi:hypothetical protein